MRLPTSVLGNLASLCGLLLIATTVSAQWPQRNAVDIATHSQRGRCEPGYWKCRSGQCVPNSYRCNGRYECIDYSDEEACRSATQPARRQQVRVQVHPERLSVRAGDDVVINCRSSSGDLRSLRWTKVGGPLPRSAQDVNGRLTLPSAQPNDAGTYVCTSREGNGVVEAQATVQVAPSGPLEQRLGACDPRSQKTCQNGDCVNIADVCNGVRDCRDGSDEDNCGGSSEGCEPNEMRCNNGRCVQKMWVCDGDDDCGDRSDESSCRQKAPGEICHPYEFQCGNQRQCVPASFHCDGQNDCQDGSDEVGCREPEVVEPPPPSKQVFVGEVITLECRALGVPAPHISWRKNWGHVCPPPRCTQTSVDGKGILTIRNSITGDSGAYTCEAINIRGRVLAVPDCIVDVRPRQSRCNADGTARTRPDGSCECKEFVVGELCDRCQANSFWLNAANPQGCLRCFCSGVTRDCSSSSWYRSEERFTPSASQLTSLKVTNSRGQPEDNSGVSVGQRGELTYSGRPRSTAYISLPQNVIGDKITAYGGNIEYTVTYSGRGSPNNDAVLILKGNEITLLHRPTSQLSADRPNAVRVPVYETSFTREDGQPCTREHLLMTLADLEGFMIKLTYVSDQSSVSISDVKFDIAINRDTQQERAWAVEECRCPEGYIGLSCQDCAPGYERSGGGLYLGTCEKQQPKPQGRCDPVGTLREENGRCICKANVRGQYCNECTPETFFLDARNPKGCIDCFCSGVTRFCESSDMYRIQISQDYAREGPSGLKVRTKDYNPPVYGRGAVQPAGGRVQFTSFQDAPAGKAFYWELPSFFHGDRVTAYGGGIKYKVSFSGDGAENREPDVVIKGNDIVLYYYHWAGIEPDMDQQVTVNIFEANWRLPDGNLASRPQLMMALSDLDSILLKMSYRADMRTASLLEASMDISKKGRTIQERALAVEVCECPEGYMGSSCEDCSPGFTRNTQGNQYLGTCQRGGQPVVRCNCNGHSDTCDASGRCLSCQHNTVGFSCGDCAPGYYGQVRGRPDDCQKCPCPPGVSCSLDSRRQVQCQCPPPKTGPRCDQCGPGYSKDPRDPRVCRPVAGQRAVTISSDGRPVGAEKEIILGSSATVTCSAPGQDIDYVRWRNQDPNRPLPPGWTSETGQLQIDDFKNSDVGDYVCEAYSKVGGTVVGKASVRFVPAKPISTQVVNIDGKGVKIVRAGETFELRCSSPNPGYQVRWHKLDNGRISNHRGTEVQGALRVNGAQTADGGEYRCVSYQGGNQGGTGTVYVVVQTNAAVLAPFKLGADAELTCPVYNIPGMRITWSRTDGRPLPPGVTQEGNTLRIPNFSGDYEGRYECRIEVENEFAFGYIQVKVEEGDVLFVEIKSEPRGVNVGDDVTFTCTVNGDSGAQFEWSKASGSLPASADVRGNKLVIRGLSASDAGVYRCTALARGNTRLSSEAGLTVGTSAGAQTVTIAVPVNPDNKELVFGGAEREVVTYPGSQVNLVCPGEVSDSVEAYRITWRRFDKQLPADAQQTPQGTLLIPSVAKDDGGTYGCHVATREGFDVLVNVSVNVGDFIPEFSGDQYIVLPSLDSHESFQVTLSFRPTQENGVILAGQTDQDGRNDYVAFYVENGKPVVKMDAGSGETVVMGEQPLLLDEWHTVVITKDGPDVTLNVNNGDEEASGQLEGETELTLGPELFVGGADFDTGDLGANIGMSNAFSGCISQVDLGDGPVEFATTQIRQEGTVEFCPVCSRSPCNNQGDCFPTHQNNRGFHCKCNEGYFGYSCESTEPIPDTTTFIPGTAEPEQFETSTIEPVVPEEEPTEPPVEPEVIEPEPIPTEPPVEEAENTDATEEPVDYATEEVPEAGSGEEGEGEGGGAVVVVPDATIAPPTENEDGCVGPNGETCNGNTCVQATEEEDFACVCNIGSTGEDCTEEVAYEGEYLKFDSPHSYVAIEKPEASNFEKTFKVKLDSTDDAVLLYAAGDPGYYAVTVTDEKLEVRLDVGGGESVIRLDDPVNVGEWYTITAVHDDREAMLEVDGEFSGISSAVGTAVPGEEKFEISGPVYIGGVPPDLEVPEGVGNEASVQGTFARKIDVDGTEVDLVNDAVGGGNIGMGAIGNACDGPVCGEGTCTDLEDRQFECECPEGVTGERCEEVVVEESADPCSDNPCGEHGTCEIVDEADFKCMCSVGFSGDDCSEFSPVEMSVAFDGENYVEFDKDLLPHMSSEKEEVIELKLRTKSDQGLILWHGQQKNAAGAAEDYLAVGLSDGYLEFKYDLGGGPAQIVSNEKVNDGVEHTIKLIRTGKDGQLIVDDSEAVTGSSQGILAMLNTDGNIFVGGVPDLELMTNGAFDNNFEGCIINLTLQGKEIDFLEDNVGGVNVSKRCEDSPLPEEEAEEGLGHSGVFIKRLRRRHLPRA